MISVQTNRKSKVDDDIVDKLIKAGLRGPALERSLESLAKAAEAEKEAKKAEKEAKKAEKEAKQAEKSLGYRIFHLLAGGR